VLSRRQNGLGDLTRKENSTMLYRGGSGGASGRTPVTGAWMSSGQGIAMSMDASHIGAALQVLVSRCPPFRFAGSPWRFVEADRDCYGPISNTEEVLTALRQQFDDALLLYAGILKRAAQGRHVLNPALCDPAGGIVALRERPEQPPYELLTRDGCLLRWATLVTPFFDNFTTNLLRQGDGPVYASGDIREVILLRAFGLPATLTKRIDRLPMAALEGLEEHLHRYELVILGWRLEALSLDVPADLAPTAQFFEDACRFLARDLCNISVWRPLAADVADLRFRLKFNKDRKLLTEFLAKARSRLVSPRAALDPTKAADFRSPRNVLHAWDDVRKRLATTASGEGQDALLAAARHYTTLVHQELIGPLREWALAQHDPGVRNLGMEAANLVELMRELDIGLRGKLGQYANYDARRGPEPFPKEPFEQYLKLCSKLSATMSALARLRASSESRRDATPERRPQMRIFPTSPLARSRNGTAKAS
jgi:hypothetical protein